MSSACERFSTFCLAPASVCRKQAATRLCWTLAQTRGEKETTKKSCKKFLSRCGPKSYFGLSAGVYGCNTLLFEPQPGCHPAILEGIRQTQVGDKCTLIPHAVSASPIHLEVDLASGCNGRYPINYEERHVRKMKVFCFLFLFFEKISVPNQETHPNWAKDTSINPSWLLPFSHILLAKIDTEGGLVSSSQIDFYLVLNFTLFNSEFGVLVVFT